MEFWCHELHSLHEPRGGLSANEERRFILKFRKVKLIVTPFCLFLTRLPSVLFILPTNTAMLKECSHCLVTMMAGFVTQCKASVSHFFAWKRTARRQLQTLTENVVCRCDWKKITAPALIYIYILEKLPVLPSVKLTQINLFVSNEYSRTFLNPSWNSSYDERIDRSDNTKERNRISLLPFGLLIIVWIHFNPLIL